MPIQIACPDCGKRYRFPDDRAGSSVECKECGSDIELPGGRSRKAKSRDDDAPVRSKSKSRKSGRSKSSGSSTGLLIAAGGGGLVILVVLLFVFMSPRANRPGVPADGNPIAANSATNPATSGASSGGSSASSESTDKKQPPVTKGWKAKVDPPTSPLVNAVASFQIPIPGDHLRQDYVLYPDVASPFALIGDPSPSNKKPRELWDLAAGSKVRDVGPFKSMSKVGLSGDGKLMAWYRHENNGGLDVFDTEGNKVLVSIPLPSGQVNVTTVAIPSPKRLFIASTVHRKLMTWKLPSGEPERTIELGENGQPNEHLAFSPGGRYAAFTGDFLARSLQIQDLETGELAGTIEFPEKILHQALTGLAFSPDGTELAAVLGQNHGATSDRVLIWNAATGASVADFLLPDPDQRPVDVIGRAPSLQWFPDRKRLFQNGQHIIDRDAKRVVYSLPAPLQRFNSKDLRRVLSNNTIATWDGTPGKITLSSTKLNESDIARAREVAASGGLIIDATLPKLTAIDRKRAAKKPASSGTWKVQADPAAAAPAPALASSVAFSDSTARPRELQVSRVSPFRAVVRSASGEDDSKALMSGIYPRLIQIPDGRMRQRYDIEPVTCRQNWLELFDLSAGKSIGRVEIPFPCELVALSPNGERALVAAMGGQGRLDVLNVPDGSHVAGCRPFVDESKQELREIQSAMFLDENTVAACSRNDHLIIFKLPTCEPIYTVDDAGIVGISPGGKLLATYSEGKIDIRDAMTGEPQGSTAIDSQVVALAFSTTGERLAVVSYTGSTSQLHLIALNDGSVSSVPIPAALGPIVWTSEQQLLVGAQKPSELIHRKAKPSTIDRHLMLIDLIRKAVLWSYDYGTGDRLAFGKMTTDNHLWVAGAPNKGSNLKLSSLTIPESSIANRLDDKSLDAKVAVKPGMTVSLQVGITDPPEAPGIANQIRDTVDAGARTNGLTVQDGQPLKLVASATVANGQGMMEMQIFGSTPGQPSKVSVQPKTLTLRLAYELNGKTIWEAKRELSNATAGLVQFANKQPQQALDEQMWKQSVGAFKELQPLSQVLTGATNKGLGVSRLAGDGAFPPD